MTPDFLLALAMTLCGAYFIIDGVCMITRADVDAGGRTLMARCYRHAGQRRVSSGILLLIGAGTISFFLIHG
jgi:hypothetical protein